MELFSKTDLRLYKEKDFETVWKSTHIKFKKFNLIKGGIFPCLSQVK